MENPHKLDILLEDITNIDPNKNLKVYSAFNLQFQKGKFRAAIRLDLGDTTLWYKQYEFLRKPSAKDIYNLKTNWYKEFLCYIVLIKLPIWKESIIILQE